MAGHSPPVSPAAERIPKNPTFETLREAATGCQACDLWQSGTQTVFGEGDPQAEIMLVGEQPGDQEDRTGRPFVGPAGKVLETAFTQVGIERKKTYVTNIVKHFKWVPKGKRRLHKTPNQAEITACRPWLDAEIDLVRPRVLVCLGATAAQALLGKHFRVSQRRGEVVESELAPVVLATVHPASILRVPDGETRQKALNRFIDDLKTITRHLESESVARSSQ